MSLMKTLARMAVGMALTKGTKALLKRGASKGARGGRGGMLSGILEGSGGTGSGFDRMLGGLLGGRSGAQGKVGGLGGLLNQLGDLHGTRRSNGGLLAGLAGGGALAAATTAQTHPATASFGEVLNSQFDETDTPPIPPSADQEEIAALLLAAMIQAAKADGQIDAQERARLLERLDGTQGIEREFIDAQLAAPVDLDALVARTPPGLGPQVYTVSLLAIDLDSRAEAEYLDRLALAYGMEAQQVNRIHDDLGLPSLYL